MASYTFCFTLVIVTLGLFNSHSYVQADLTAQCATLFNQWTSQVLNVTTCVSLLDPLSNSFFYCDCQAQVQSIYTAFNVLNATCASSTDPTVQGYLTTATYTTGFYPTNFVVCSTCAPAYNNAYNVYSQYAICVDELNLDFNNNDTSNFNITGFCDCEHYVDTLQYSINTATQECASITPDDYGYDIIENLSILQIVVNSTREEYFYLCSSGVQCNYNTIEYVTQAYSSYLICVNQTDPYFYRGICSSSPCSFSQLQANVTAIDSLHNCSTSTDYFVQLSWLSVTQELSRLNTLKTFLCTTPCGLNISNAFDRLKDLKTCMSQNPNTFCSSCNQTGLTANSTLASAENYCEADPSNDEDVQLALSSEDELTKPLNKFLRQCFPTPLPTTTTSTGNTPTTTNTATTTTDHTSTTTGTTTSSSCALFASTLILLISLIAVI